MGKIKVLQEKGVLTSDGATAILLNLAKELQDEVQFDFLLSEEEGNDWAYKFEELGSQIYYLPVKGENLLIREWKRIKLYTAFFKEHSYDIVHFNTDSMKKADMLFCAWKGKVSHRIFHAHNAYSENMRLLLRIPPVRGVLKWLIALLSTDLVACSSMAAEWMFPKSYQNRVHIVKNGIEVENYKFDLQKRKEIRESYNLKNCFVVGCVARFVDQKNYTFLIDIFSELCKIMDNSKLLLVGDGERMEEISQKVKDLGLEDQVIFVGTTDHVPDYLSAMDVFVLPSKFEGLGMVYIEAQTSGLYCFASDAVPLEAKASDRIEFVELEKDAEFWAQKISSCYSKLDKNDRQNAWKEVVESGYSIHDSAKNLLEIYVGRSIDQK